MAFWGIATPPIEFAASKLRIVWCEDGWAIGSSWNGNGIAE
jgi:hypothetical protein